MSEIGHSISVSHNEKTYKHEVSIYCELSYCSTVIARFDHYEDALAFAKFKAKRPSFDEIKIRDYVDEAYQEAKKVVEEIEAEEKEEKKKRRNHE